MNSLMILIIVTITVPSISARLKREDWYNTRDITFLSSADFKLASLIYDGNGDDSFQRSDDNAPYDDPESQQTYYEGDMMIKADDEKKVAMFSAKRWPNGRIPYMMENKFSQEERAAIARGMMVLQDESCIKFEPKKDKDKDYVMMRRGPGCAAHVGRISGQQWLFLGQGCFHLETVVHELMHAVGFIHEQSRPDRDAYVKIIWDNIKDGAERNFRKHTTDFLADHGFPYDLMSVMHYRQYAFSKNRKPTIIPKKSVPYLRCRGVECPSDMDVKKINYLYQCKDGESGFLGPNEVSHMKPFHKKRSKKRDYEKDLNSNYEKDFLIGEKFYEAPPMPPMPRPRLSMPRINAHHHVDDEYEQDPDNDFHSEYEFASPVGPCMGENCYNSYDMDIDGNVPGETQVSQSVLVAPGENAQNKNGYYGITSWLENLFHW